MHHVYEVSSMGSSYYGIFERYIITLRFLRVDEEWHDGTFELSPP